MKKITNVIFIIVMVTAELLQFAFANGEGIEPLFKNIIKDQAGEVALYLEGDNSPDIRDSRGNPALVVATSYKRLSIVRMLLEAQANPNLTNASGMTALMMAASKKHQGLMQLLLEHGANVNQQNPQTGYTALMYAVQKNYPEGVKLLLEHQADVNLKSNDETTALEIAQTNHYTEIIHLFLLDGVANLEQQTGKPTDTEMTTQVHDDQTVTSPTPTAEPVSQATPITATTAEYIGKADYLLNQGHLNLARGVLKKGYENTQEMALLRKWFTVDEQWFHQLKHKNQKQTLSWRAPDSQFQQGWNFFSNRQHQIQYERNNPIPIPSLEEVEQILAEYDELKQSFLERTLILQHKIHQISSAQLRQAEELFRKHQALAEEVKLARYNYISFNVVSPYLARAEQLIFLSENAYFLSLSYSPDILHDALTVLVDSAHHNLIFQTEPVVREQFFNVYEILMTTVGESAEFKELPVIQTIAQKLTVHPAFDIAQWWD